MKRLLLFGLTIMILGKVSAQTPSIQVTTFDYNKTLTCDDETSSKIIIKNTGSRSLDWKINMQSPSITFTKPDSADISLTKNQDRISRNIWIVRDYNSGLYNYKNDGGYSSSSTPSGTLWAMGTTGSVAPEFYTSWYNALGWPILNNIFNPMSIYLEDEEKYGNIKFNSWTAGGLGGGFSYTRDGFVNWLKAKKVSGSLLPGKADTIDLTFLTAYIFGGQHQGNIVISSNDPVHPKVSVPASLNAIAGGQANINTSDLNFGNVIINTSSSLYIPISNDSLGTVQITSITSTSGKFSTTPQSFPGLSKGEIKINVLPTAQDTIIDTLVIATSDPNNAIIKVAASVIGVGKPVFALNKTALTKKVIGGSAVDTLVISNNGASPLTWAIGYGSNEPSVYFKKENFSDNNLPVNQDRINNDLWLTRSNDGGGLYNILTETSGSDNPDNTEWCLGHTSDVISSGSYGNLKDAAGRMRALPGHTLSMHEISTNQYFDVTFESWTPGTGNSVSGGGGFAYTRKEIPVWYLPSSYSGIVAAGEKDTVVFTIDMNGKKTGTYQTSIVVKSNDNSNTSRTLPVTIAVVGTPQKSVNVSSVAFGNGFLNTSLKKQVIISNAGTDTLKLSSISKKLTVYTVNKTSMNVLAGKKDTITVSFKPTAESTYNDTLFFISNLGDTTKIPLSGTGILPPNIQVTTSAVNINQTTDETATVQITVNNTGSTDLNYTLNYSNSAPVKFTKPGFADYFQPVYQDIINDSVKITRQSSSGIFNIAKENEYNTSAPALTQWVRGYSADHIINDYMYWVNAHGSNPQSEIGDVMSMNITGTSVYYDVFFTAFSNTSSGAGFAYTRYLAPLWANADNRKQTIAAGGSQVITMSFKATELNAGKYITSAYLESNDPDQPMITFPVTMVVTGKPAIEINTTSVDFDKSYIGVAKKQNISISNTGRDTLFISSITKTLSVYSVQKPDFILPGQSANAVVSFIGTAETTYEDTLKFHSNADTIIAIPVTGFSVIPPKATINKINISHILYDGETASDTILISNVGKEDLLMGVSHVTLIDSTLDRINRDYVSITDLIPNMINFSYDGGNNNISDGYSDMYDGGNRLNTSSATSIIYSDNSISTSSNFGDNSRYYTRHLPGLFVLGAELNGINSFWTSGNLGADGNGAMNTTKIESNGYTGFVKRVYNAGDPSVNHIIIVPTSTAISQSASTDTDDDYDKITGLSETKSLYYLLFASANGGYVTDDEMKSIMDAFINVAMPIILTDTIKAGKTDTTIVSFNANDYKYGLTIDTLYFNTTDPLKPKTKIPVTIDHRAFKATTPFANVKKNIGFGTFSVDLKQHFSLSGNIEIISSSSLETVVSDSLDMSDTTLIISEKGVGTSIITIILADDAGNIQYFDFNFVVNGSPVLAHAIADVTILSNQTYSVDLNTKFTDPNNDVLTYSFVYSSPEIGSFAKVGNEWVFTPLTTGSTSITVTANDNFGTPATETFIIQVDTVPFNSVAEMSLAQVSLYPNPANNFITLTFAEKLSGGLTLSIFDVTGKTVQNKQLSSGITTETIQVSGLSKGVYMVNLSNETGIVMTTKLVLK